MKKKSTKLQLVVVNPPSVEQSIKMIEHISEVLKQKFYM